MRGGEGKTRPSLPCLLPEPHVYILCGQVALRMKSQGKSVRALDTIPYIICKDGSDNPARYTGFAGRAWRPPICPCSV